MPSLLHAVARNPALPPELLRQLLNRAETDGELAWALADRPDLGPEQVRQLAERHEGAALLLAEAGLLGAEDVDPLTRPTAAVRLLDEGRGKPDWALLLARSPDPAVRERLAACPDLPPDAAGLLALDESVDVVAELAVNTTHADLLTHLAAHPVARVRRWAAANEAMPAELLAALLDDPEVPVREQAAGNPATPGAAAARLAADHVMVRQTLATHPGLPADAYHRLGGDEIPLVRANLAGNPGIDDPLIRRLAEDDGHDVRRSLAHHPRVPLDVLARLAAATRTGPALLPRIATADPAELTELAGSSEPRVRALVAARRDLPAALRDRLAADPDARVVKAVAPHPGLAGRRLSLLVDRFGPGVATAVARNPGTPTDLLDRLAALPLAGRARHAVAAHPNASPALLADCLAAPDRRTAEAAAANPALPVAVMAELVAGHPYGP
ncbi:hypothetical protein ABTZ03_10885 [Kitasatospora sp. NPDC096077]|uniref:hypothetical protein n=1 Tax=Kitasatospora sp. NPDC096077 TaxID=3155544 RepID=UPI00331F16F2